MSDIEKKKWKVRTIDGGKEISFYPTFEVKMEPGQETINATSKEVECVSVEMTVNNDEGKEVSLTMNFLDLYLFVYFIANEELRRQLQLRYERQVTNIPYEVTFALSPDEIQKKIAKRLITLSVDEISMSIAHAAANKLLGKAKPETLESFIDRRRKEIKIKK